MNSNNATVTVTNTRTQQTATLRGIWLNEVTGQYVANVKIGRMSASWNAAETAVL